MRMKASVFLFFVLPFLADASENASVLCRDEKFVVDFFRWGEEPDSFSEIESRHSFVPFLSCLKDWVDDGGERDQIALRETSWPYQREHIKSKAMELIDLLILQKAISDHTIAAWIRSSIASWPERVQWDGWKTLADLKDREAIPILRQACRTKIGLSKNMAWHSLASLTPETAGAELESLTKTTEDYKMLGFVLLSIAHPNSIPTLQRLIEKDPGKAEQYRQHIHLLQSSILN